MTDASFKRLVIFGVIAAIYGLYHLWKVVKTRQKKGAQTMTDTNVTDELIYTSLEYLNFTQQVTIEKFNLALYDRWHIDQNEATLIFYINDVPKVKADIQIIGSHSKNTGIWQWSINNDSITDKCVTKLGQVWEIMQKLEGKWYLDPLETEVVDQDFINKAVALNLFVLEGKGYYMAPSQSANVYLLMTDINWVQTNH